MSVDGIAARHAGKEIAEEAVTGTGGVDRRDSEGGLVDVAGLAVIVRALTAAGDDKMRHAAFLRRPPEHLAKRRRLAFIDDEKIRVRQQARGDRGVERRGAVGKFQPAAARRLDKGFGAVRFVLQQRPVSGLRGIQHGHGAAHVDCCIRRRAEQDLVLAVDRYRDDGVAGGIVAVLDFADIDAGLAHFRADPAVFGACGTDMDDRRAGTRQRNRLVGALAAEGPPVIEAGQRFTRRRKMRHRVEQVDIDGAEIEDRHHKTSGNLHLNRH